MPGVQGQDRNYDRAALPSGHPRLYAGRNSGIALELYRVNSNVSHLFTVTTARQTTWPMPRSDKHVSDRSDATSTLKLDRLTKILKSIIQTELLFYIIIAYF